MRGHARYRPIGSAFPQGLQGGQLGFAELGHVVAPQVGHLYEVILRFPASGAYPAERAQRTMVDGVGLACRRRDQSRLEPPTHPSVVGREVVVPETSLLPDAEQHVHVLRWRALDS